jgi:hypothetical protein
LLQGSHYQLTEHGRLIPDGASVATERLPVLDWRPIRESIELQLPIAAMSGSLKTTLLPKLQLRRSGEERPATAALIELHTLLNWCERVPQFRLNKLTACVAADQVLVLGNPLPSVPCQYLCVDGGLITPVGMTWYPQLESELVLEHFDVHSTELLLWMSTDEWSIIPRTLLRPLQLASMRAYADGYNGRGVGANL